MRTTLIKSFLNIALSRLDQQEALRAMVTKVSASTVKKTSTSSGGKIPLQSHKTDPDCAPESAKSVSTSRTGSHARGN